MDKERIKKAVSEILKAIDEDPSKPELKKTPERFADMMEDILSGKGKDIAEILKATHELKHDEMVIVRDVPFYSMCEHHLIPFFGKCHVAYIPKKNRIVGVSELVKIVDVLSRKLQLQERLTTEIANSIMKHLEPKGAGVVIEARHLCIEMRGLKVPAQIVTSAVRGLFRDAIKTREEFLKLIR
jgi:GTP cyclohydrolase I